MSWRGPSFQTMMSGMSVVDLVGPMPLGGTELMRTMARGSRSSAALRARIPPMEAPIRIGLWAWGFQDLSWAR